jgi:hypothetical protein
MVLNRVCRGLQSRVNVYRGRVRSSVKAVESERAHDYNGPDEELAHELGRQPQGATGANPFMTVLLGSSHGRLASEGGPKVARPAARGSARSSPDVWQRRRSIAPPGID